MPPRGLCQRSRHFEKYISGLDWLVTAMRFYNGAEFKGAAVVGGGAQDAVHDVAAVGQLKGEPVPADMPHPTAATNSILCPASSKPVTVWVSPFSVIVPPVGRRVME